ncbi:MAG: tRNA pseudouridine(13) synthase TruD, partial [Gammaproteobacteria bacterium]
ADLIDGLIAADVQAARRSLRLMPQALKWEWEDATTLLLEFELPAGTYATVVVAELVEIGPGN